MECKFNSYSVNPTSVYLTPTALLETATWGAGGNGACLPTEAKLIRGSKSGTSDRRRTRINES